MSAVVVDGGWTAAFAPCPWQVGDLVEGRVFRMSAEGAWISMAAGQGHCRQCVLVSESQVAVPASTTVMGLLPCSTSSACALQVGDDLTGLRITEITAGGVVLLSSCERASVREPVVVELPPGFGRGRAGTRQGRGAASAAGRGRGKGCTAPDCDAALVAGSAGASSSFAQGVPSWPASRYHHAATPVALDGSEGSDACRYSREVLLSRRVRNLHGRNMGDRNSKFQSATASPTATTDAVGNAVLPSLVSLPSKELDASLLAHVAAGKLPPKGWTRCSVAARRNALLVALKASHMHCVFAMQPESERFRDELSCIDLGAEFLRSAMQSLCEDLAAWGHSSPRLAPIAWLLERGAPMEPLLRPAIHSANVTAHRINGLRLLKELGVAASAAVGEVLLCLGDADARVRRAAADVLGSVGEFGDMLASAHGTEVDAPTGPSMVAAKLARRLKDEDVRVREAAAKALGRQGRAGVDAAAQMLHDQDAEMRGLAAISLEFAATAAVPYAPELVRWLRTEQPALRAVAARALGGMGEAAGNASAQALAEALREDPEASVREQAASALGRFGPAGKVHALSLSGALTDDVDPYVQEAAAAALGALM